jgi:LCP family protein required for cell wall assembly
MFLTVVTVLALSASGVVAFVVWDSYQRFTSNSVELPSDGIAQVPPKLSFDPYPGEVTFLLTGTDECEEEFSYLFGDRCDGSEEGARNDVTLLVHIPEDHSRATIVSFPRDLMMEMPACTNEAGVTISGSSNTQINTAYDRGGLGCVAAAVENISGLDIPFAAKISWGGVITITDKLGGVDVCIANGIYDKYTGLALDPGTHTLQGVEALQFLRTRHGLSDGSDLARISNQQLYMSALLKKMTSDGTLSDFFTLSGIAETVVNNVEHSSSLNEPSTLVSLALLLKDLPLQEISFLQLPTFADPSNPNRVVENAGEAQAFWDAIKAQQDIAIEDRQSGALVEEPAPVDPSAPVVEETAPPAASAPGLRADANACANGAG